MHTLKRLFLAIFIALPAWSAAPVVFFTDLDSGPNSGGEGGGGAYVRIYGLNFGAAQGSSTVTVGGGAVTVKRWEDLWMTGDRNLEVLTVQLTSSSATGAVVVTVNGVASSSTVSFTVRPGTIDCVSATGSDSASGTLSSGSCWATLTHARDTMAAGDITYAENGVCACSDDGSGWNSTLLLDANSGASGRPKAIVAYPGATATIGSISSTTLEGIRSKGTGSHYWTFAGLMITGGGLGFQWMSDHNWRMVGNTVTCPAMNGQAGCADMASAQPGSTPAHDNKFYGNLVYNVGTNYSQASVTALQHGIYVSQLNYNLDIGWNTIKSINGCRGIQVNSNNNGDPNSGGSYSLSIHDNVIHDTPCDGIILATVNPNAGAVKIYNNVIYNAGQGPNNTEQSGTWTCIDAQGWVPGTAAQYSEGGTVQIYHNTMYACGKFAGPPYNESSAGIIWEDGTYSDGTPVTSKSISVIDNIMYLTTGPSGLPYFYAYQGSNGALCTSACSHVTGSNNIFYNAGSSVSNTAITGGLFSNPQMSSPAAYDFSLTSGSPAIGAGITEATADFNGVPRPNPPAIGAFEYQSSGSGAKPNPPSGLIIRAN
jgi:IPT/TIG domain-containing protein